MSGWGPVVPGYRDLAALVSASRTGDVDWEAVDLSQLTAQVRAAVDAGEVEMSEAADLVADLASLVSFKATHFLPAATATDPDAEDSELDQGEVLMGLLEYRAFRDAALAIEDLAVKREAMFARMAPEVLAWEESLAEVEGISLEHLLDALTELLSGVEANETAETLILQRQQLPLPVAMDLVKERLISAGGSLLLPDVFSEAGSRARIVAIFLALLEMIRVGDVCLERDASVGKIRVALGRQDDYE